MITVLIPSRFLTHSACRFEHRNDGLLHFHLTTYDRTTTEEIAFTD
jgi:hypothetical protein